MRVSNRFVAIVLFLFTAFFSCSLPPEEEEEYATDDLSHQLPWSGERGKFSINSRRGIRLDDRNYVTGTAYLTIPSSEIRDTRWEFGIHLSFNPSAKNYARFYLASSSEELSGNLSGYYIQIGGAKDNVGLYRQEGNESRLLVSGRELMKGDKAPKLYVKTECDKNGYWTLRTRLESESEYTTEGGVQDTGIRSSVCCGIYCVYTPSRCKGFTFHHIRLSHEVDTAAEPKEDSPVAPPAGMTELPDDVRGMLLFNEVMYDNAKDGAEYIEIYNPTGQTITLPALYLYKMDKDGKVYSTVPLYTDKAHALFSIEPESYLCFTQSAERIMRKHRVGQERIIETPKFPSLNNKGGYIALSRSEKPAKGNTFDTCGFWDWMHNCGGSKFTGISLEKKSPELPSVNNNWQSCKDSTGGTPGRRNSEPV